jgi:hypothetical protein
MTVEDVGGMPPARINRIVGADLLDDNVQNLSHFQD